MILIRNNGNAKARKKRTNLQKNLIKVNALSAKDEWPAVATLGLPVNAEINMIRPPNKAPIISALKIIRRCIRLV